MTEWGFKATKEDLIGYMEEISKCEYPPDIAFTQRVTDLMHQNVSTASLRTVRALTDNSGCFSKIRMQCMKERENITLLLVCK